MQFCDQAKLQTHAAEVIEQARGSVSKLLPHEVVIGTGYIELGSILLILEEKRHFLIDGSGGIPPLYIFQLRHLLSRRLKLNLNSVGFDNKKYMSKSATWIRK